MEKEEGMKREGKEDGKGGGRQEWEGKVGEISPPRSFLKVGAYGRCVPWSPSFLKHRRME